MEVANLTPFAAEDLLYLSARGEEMLQVIVKATYALTADGPRLDERQEPVRLADEYHGAPGQSSLKYAGDSAPFKPATDVILLGSAYPADRERRQVDVRLKVGKLDKTVRVFGERRWESHRDKLRPGEPQPFEKMPLRWERAFGGSDVSTPGAEEAEPRNPVGVGFRARRSALPVKDAPLPNLENAKQFLVQPTDQPEPAGFGFLGPHWQPRLSRAGTYDETWLNQRAPLLPLDFDPLFFQTAPVDQIYPGYVEAGTPVEVLHAMPGGRLAFALPDPKVNVEILVGEDWRPLDMKLDTMVIDGDALRLMLVWRGSLPVHNQLYDVEWIRIAAEGVS